MRPEQALMQALAGGTAPTPRRGSALQGVDQLKFALMTHIKFVPESSFKTSEMRSWIEGKFKKMYPDL